MTVVTQNKIDILTGMIAPFGMSSVATGWLACDGSAVSRTTYAELFTAIGTTWGAGDGSGTFNIPDLEGAFLRGTGANATHNMADGNDFAGPNVGSFENDQFQGHYHENLYVSRDVAAGSSYTMDRVNDASVSPTSPTARAQDAVADASNGTPRVGDETRPFNAGVKYCIKY